MPKCAIQQDEIRVPKLKYCVRPEKDHQTQGLHTVVLVSRKSPLHREISHLKHVFKVAHSLLRHLCNIGRKAVDGISTEWRHCQISKYNVTFKILLTICWS